MKLRFTPQALADAKRIKTWWRRNRPGAPEAFEQEFNAALERHHLYYTMDGNDVVVLSVWGAPRGRGPKL